MRASSCGVHQPVNLLPQVQNEPGKLVYHDSVSLSGQTSFLHLVSISIDRFVAVAFPVRHKIVMEKGGLNVMLIASWSLPILTSVLSNIIPTGSTLVFDLIGFGIVSFSCFSIFFSFTF